jgi:hypothetical protein
MHDIHEKCGCVTLVRQANHVAVVGRGGRTNDSPVRLTALEGFSKSLSL